MPKKVLDPQKEWQFNRPRLARLAEAYATADANGEESFIFDGVKLLTRYAKYLIEYLDRALD